MSVLTVDLIRKSEEEAVRSGAFSFTQLMHTAGTAAGKIINEKFHCKEKKILILCGNGNNGGDGFVVADYLCDIGADVSIMLPLGNPVTKDAEHYFKKLKGIKTVEVFENCYDIVIDAVFGIGLNRPLNTDLIALFECVNNTNSIRIAIDIPSGVCANTGKILGGCFDADFTVTFIALKPCFLLPSGSDFCGETVIADIGVKPVGIAYELNKPPIFKKRRRNSHKGNFGTALLICGSYGMAGAAILSTRAALRSGVGIAKCLICEGIYNGFTAAVPEAVCLPVKQSENGSFDSNFVNIKNLTENCDALLFGCGVSQSTDCEKILEDILKNSTVPCVIDADGINLLSARIELLRESKVSLILTPHPAEMARLSGCTVKQVEADRIGIAKDFAQKYNCTLVLKGADTVIAEPDGCITLNHGGNPGLATGGSGDVLAGIIVSLLAQGYSVSFAAKAAVYMHTAAGKKAAQKRSFAAMLPSDVIEEL